MKKVNKFVIFGAIIVSFVLACTKEITEDLILNFKIDFPTETTIGFLDEPIETQFSIEGGANSSGDFKMKYNAKKGGHFLVNDQRIEEGDFTTLPGSSPFTVEYVGTKTGRNTVVVTIQDPLEREESFELVYDIADTAFDFEVVPSLNEIYVGQTIDLELEINETSVSEYDVFYLVSSENTTGAGEVIIAGEVVEPNAAVTLSSGNATWQFRALEVGEVELQFTATNGFGIEVDKSITLQIGETPDFTFAATLNTTNTITVNNPAAINFVIEASGVPSSYTMSYTTSNVGSLIYNEISYNPGDEIPVVLGNSAGAYIGTIVGDHDLEFTVSNANDEPVTKEASVRVSYIEAQGSEPVITLNGEATITLAVGNQYEELGATAADAEDGDITDAIQITGQVNTNAAGEYPIVYTVEDSDGNTTIVVRIVEVIANEPPVITINGDTTITLMVGAQYTDQGAIATDTEDGDLSDQIVIGGTYPGNTDTAGTYTITYNVEDSNGLAAEEQVRTISINAIDTGDQEAPVITLEGEATITIIVGTTYTEPGFSATDNVDGDITANVIVDDSALDINNPGSYEITYNVSDAAGNAAAQVIRTVVVNAPDDQEAPVILLEGEATIILEVGIAYIEPGFTATDNVDGDITANVVVDDSNLDINTPGSYTITYNVSDAAGNAATEVVRTIEVEDREAPVITLEGENTLTLTIGTTYQEPGFTATDNVDGDITANVIVDDSNLNTNAPGSYTITYNVSDASGNAATEVVRTIEVQDTEAPVITLVGESTIVIQKDTPYEELGASAVDNVDGTVTVTISGTVNESIPDTYIIAYSAEDSSGNEQTVTRSVKVNDPPVAAFTVSQLSGIAPLTVSLNNSGSTDSDGTIGLSNWKFNGEGSSTAGFPYNIERTFDTPGSYVIRLEVTDNDGGVGVLERTVEVFPVGTPTWDLTTGLLTANPGSEVRITIGSGGSSGYVIEVEARADTPTGVLLGNLITGSGAPTNKVEDTFTMPSSAKVYFKGMHNDIGSGSGTKIFVNDVEIASINMGPGRPIPRDED